MPKEPIGFSLWNARYNGLFPESTRIVNRRSFAVDSVSFPCTRRRISSLLSLPALALALVLPDADLLLHLPTPLGSTGITPLPRYYGCSDSCPGGSSYPYQRQ